jgi:hypothetical protein
VGALTSIHQTLAADELRRAHLDFERARADSVEKHELGLLYSLFPYAPIHSA